MKRRFSVLWVIISLNAAIMSGMDQAMLVNRLHSSDLFEKVLAVKDYLSKPGEYSQISVGENEEILNTCRSSREIWIQYVAGYVKFKNTQFSSEMTQNWPIQEHRFSVQLQEYARLHSLYGACLLPSGDLLAGLTKEVKILQNVTYKYYFWPIYNTQKQSHTYFKLIHLPTKSTLLQKRVDDAYTSVIINDELPIQMEIVSKDSDSCHKVDIASYYEALSNYQKASLNDFVFYWQYNASY